MIIIIIIIIREESEDEFSLKLEGVTKTTADLEIDPTKSYILYITAKNEFGEGDASEQVEIKGKQGNYSFLHY